MESIQKVAGQTFNLLKNKMPWNEMHGGENNYDIVQYLDDLQYIAGAKVYRKSYTKHIHIGYYKRICSWNCEHGIYFGIVGHGNNITVTVSHGWINYDVHYPVRNLSPVYNITKLLQQIREFPNILARYKTKWYFNNVVKEELMAVVWNPAKHRGEWLYLNDIAAI